MWVCASAHKNGRLVEPLGLRIINAVGNLPLQQDKVIIES
jgi:hypothetical protein